MENEMIEDGLYCDGGSKLMSIGSEGNVYICNTLVYQNEYSIGNLFTDDIVLGSKFRRCPIQSCNQICDRHWSKKKVYKDGVIIDEQDITDPNYYNLFKNTTSILFAPTWKCNYNCSYCGLPQKELFPDIPNACDEFTAEEWIEAFSRFLKLNNIDGGIWHTNGGEPLYFKDVSKLFSFFNSQNFKICLTTNLSYPIYDKIITVLPTDRDSVEINCSLHPSDKNFDWSMFKSRVQSLASFDYNVSVNFVGHPDQISLSYEYKEWCDEIGVSFSLVPLIGDVGDAHFSSIEDYPDPMKNIIKELTIVNLQDSTSRFSEGERV
jgi:radical SAM protein with 4Fe4S-binding SPASM domain